MLNLLIVLLITVSLFFLSNGHRDNERIIRRMATFGLVNLLCWLLNIAIVVLLAPAPHKKQNRFFTLYLPSYLVTVPVCTWFADWIANIFGAPALPDHPSSLVMVIFCNLLSLLTIALIISTQERESIKLENAALKTFNLQAQHEKLKHQLHPHFLFNSLNALKTLIRRDPQQAESYLIKLSEFLRFSISHNEQNIVPLKEELKFSQYYLEMQKTRFQDSLSFHIDVPSPLLEFACLPVFSLQLLLENAIKHNMLTRDKPLHIRIQYQEPDTLLVENNITARLPVANSTGVGLKNLSERYQLLTQQTIKIESDDLYFRVHLKLI